MRKRALRLDLFGDGRVDNGQPAEKDGAPDSRKARAGEKPESAPRPGEADAGREGRERREAFEKLVKGEYKDLFAQRVQRIIDERFKQVKGLEARMADLAPALALLEERYGVGRGDARALSEAILRDNSRKEGEEETGGQAEDSGEQSDLAKPEKEAPPPGGETGRPGGDGRANARWNWQVEQCKRFYPGFDVSAEWRHPATGPRFRSLILRGLDVRTAYEVVHRDEILGGAMRYTAQRIRQKTIDDIRARGLRPQENGGSGQGAAELRRDVRRLTREEREEIERRVARGERIAF